MADGYAQASGQLAVANVHVQPGIANALSGILNAARTRVPLLVTVGQQVSGLLATEPFLGGDVLGMARPLAKAVFEPTTGEALGHDVRAAIDIALTPPRGPVVLSIPLDVQAGSAPAGADARDPLPATREPAPDRVQAAARLLEQARSPVLIAGDGVADAHAVSALGHLAERLGAPVFGEPMAARVALAWNHPLWAGQLQPFGDEIRRALEPHDVAFAIGMPVFRLFGHSPGAPLPEGIRLVHAEVDPHEVGKNHRPQVGLVGDPGRTLRSLLEALGPRDAASADRSRVVRRQIAERRRRARRAAVAQLGGPGIPPAAFASAVASSVGPNDLVVDEAVTSGRALRALICSRRPGTWLAHRGSALGWGLPAAVGAAMARPGQRVMSLHGDGGLLFGISALWTAARERTPLALAVADNRGYEILRAGLEGLTGSAEAEWPGLRLDEPELDLPGLIRAHGATVEQVDHKGALGDAFSDLWERSVDGPAALVVRVSGRTPRVGHPLP